MKRYKFLLSILFSILTIIAYGQDNEIKISLLSGPKGVFVRINGQNELSKFKIGEKQFTVKRKRLDEASFKTVGKLEAANSEQKIKSLITQTDLAEFESVQDIKMLDFINSKPAYLSVSIFGELSIEMLQAWGLGFQDKTAEKGHFYIYRVYEIKGNAETLFSESGVFHNSSNEFLKEIKTDLSAISGLDSSVRFNWNIAVPFIEIPEAIISKQEKLFASVNEKTLQASKKNYQEIVGFLRNEAKIFSSFALTQFNTHHNVYYRINKDVDWKFHSKRIAGIDSLGNTFITADVICNPEDLVEMKVVPEDVVFNQGIESQIARGVAVSNNMVTLIYGLDAKDSTNSIILNWAKLPEKAYYSGIELSRSYGNEPITKLAILPVNANTYTDFDIFPAGQIFTYYVRPLFIEKQDLRQDIPASTAQSCSKFSRPLPPFNLKVETQNGKPTVTWETTNDKAIHSYHVYRGTNTTEFDLISNSIHKPQFVDTTSIISPRLTYFYKVQAMNLTQDTSDYSVSVSYSPEFSANDMYSPDIIETSAVNNQMWLKWADVKLNDDFVEGYQLERQKVGEATFTKIHPGILQNALFTDTTALLGVEYNYRVTSVSTNSFLGTYSKTSTVSIPLPENVVTPISDIRTTNLSKTIKISWPSVDTDDITSYFIYKKSPTDVNFQRIGMVAKGIFEFEDENVERDEIYIYSVSATNTTGEESILAQKKSIYRESVK